MNYPDHKYSNHIDQNFSFSNRVYPSNEDMVDKLKNMRCDGGIMLEPRLQEYLKKKKYYKENNIMPCVKLENEFQITSRDKKALRAFLRGKRDMYRPNSKYSEFNQEGPRRKQHFPSRSFRNNDPRVQKLKKENRNIKPTNMGMFAPERGESFYEGPTRKMDNVMDSRDLVGSSHTFTDPVFGLDGTEHDKLGGPMGYNSMGGDNKYELTGTGFDLDDTRFDPRSNPRIYPGPEKYNKYSSQYRIDPSSPNNSPPNNSCPNNSCPNTSYPPDPRNNYIISEMTKKNTENTGNYSAFNAEDSNKGYKLLNESVSDILKKNKRYGEFSQPSFSEKSDMDLNHKMVIPHMAQHSRKNLNTASYQMMPYISERQPIKDAELETSLIRGMPSANASRKSYGYRQPEENYFQYIDDDFQNPDNSVEGWIRGGVSTRRDNKSLAKQNVYRDIM